VFVVVGDHLVTLGPNPFVLCIDRRTQTEIPFCWNVARFFGWPTKSWFLTFPQQGANTLRFVVLEIPILLGLRDPCYSLARPF